MNDHTYARLESLLTSRVSSVAEVLQKQCKESGLPGRISHGSWSNEGGVNTAYISCSLDHDPSKDAIEATWHIASDQEHVILQGDICYSSGTIIKPILDMMIDFTDADNAMLEIESVLDEGLAETLRQLKNILGCQGKEDGQGT